MCVENAPEHGGEQLDLGGCSHAVRLMGEIGLCAGNFPPAHLLNRKSSV